MSATPDSTIPDPERLIADLQRQLAECKAERDEALQRETATASILQVINSSPGDLVPVFDAMLDRAMRLCEASYGHLRIYDGESLVPVAIRGASELVDHLEPRSASAASPSGRIIAGERIVHILDLKEIYLQGHEELRALVETGGARTVLTVALRKEDTLLGSLTLYRREVRLFSERQIALVENFASQAVIAMENTRLLTQTREALEQQTATAEVLQVINSSPGDLAPVFDAMLERAMRLCEASFGYLLTYDGRGFLPVADRGHPAFSAWVREQGRIVPEPGTSNARIVDGEAVIQVADVANNPFYRGDTAMGRAVLEIGGFRTVLTVALRKDGALRGVIHIYRQEVRPFADQQVALLQNFAAQAVIAMENARLLGELRQRTDEVAELNRGLEARVAAQVEELRRVGRLKRFLAPQLAEMIIAKGEERILESHRRDIVVVFCDVRGYTAFTETAEPEDVLDFLRQYHGALGPLVSQFEGTLDQFSGDGIMVFFNDPVLCPDPAERAVKMAMAMREAASELIAAWHRHGSELGFGVGIAQGYATLGQIGFSERSGYTAIGTVCNLAARLCGQAKDGQILVSSRVAGAVKEIAKLEDLGNLEVKGLSRPVAAFNVTEPVSREPAAGCQT
jgi:class 3 adenylate cyclase